MEHALSILAVDDEPGVLALVRRCLDDQSFSLMEASSGQDALEQIAKSRPLNLLITDLRMPVMAGEELARQVRALQPGLPVLYLTSHADRLFAARRSLPPGEGYLDKPFTREGLRQAIAQLLFDRTTLERAPDG
jgi:CheY-like chemotaxis protein